MAKTKRSGKGWTSSELGRILGASKDPVLKEILNLYMDAVIAKQEGWLSPEEVKRLEGFNELVRCMHQLHYGTPKPTPEQALTLENRIKELSQSAPIEAVDLGGAA